MIHALQLKIATISLAVNIAVEYFDFILVYFMIIAKSTGEFAALGHKPLEFVEKNNLVVLYDNSDPDGIYWHERYANKTIEISKMYNGKLVSFNASIGNNYD